MKKSDTKAETRTGAEASALISEKIAEIGGWRGETLARMRRLIHEADPEVVEEWKWMGTPIWSHDGILCTGESYQKVVKLTFAKGASLRDPARLFNSSLDGNVRRALDIREGEVVDADAFQALVREAVAWNGLARAGRASAAKRPQAAKKAAKKAPTKAVQKAVGKAVKKPAKKAAKSAVSQSARKTAKKSSPPARTKKTRS